MTVIYIPVMVGAALISVAIGTEKSTPVMAGAKHKSEAIRMGAFTPATGGAKRKLALMMVLMMAPQPLRCCFY